MTFAEWLVISLRDKGKVIEDLSGEDLAFLRRAFQAGEINMRYKATSQVIKSDTLDKEMKVKISKVISNTKLDGG